jgi:hypothetical protein
VTGTVDGSNFTYIDQNSPVSGGTGASKGSNAPNTSAVYQSYWYNDNNNNTYFQFNKGTLNFQGSTAPSAQFADFFKTGSYPYSGPGVDPVNGIVISYFDNSNNEWRTDNAPGTQTGSTFVITAVQDATILGTAREKVTATFNCKVYNSSGQSKTITNGKTVTYFEND